MSDDHEDGEIEESDTAQPPLDFIHERLVDLLIHYANEFDLSDMDMLRIGEAVAASCRPPPLGEYEFEDEDADIDPLLGGDEEEDG